MKDENEYLLNHRLLFMIQFLCEYNENVYNFIQKTKYSTMCRFNCHSALTE